MARLNTSPPRTLATLVALGAMLALFVAAGRWQLRRADERRAISQAISTGSSHAPLRLQAGTPAREFVKWRRATATGTWANAATVLVENRSFNGRPGLWVATPLLLDEASRTAVVVLRGWVPSPLGPEAHLQPIPAPTATLTLEGTMTDQVPRLFELWSIEHRHAGKMPAHLPAPGASPPQVQNIDLGAYARASGLKLLPVVIEQTSETADGFGRQWPQPSQDANQNISYALQWFSFAAIAAIAWLVVAARALRRRMGGAAGDPPDSPAARP